MLKEIDELEIYVLMDNVSDPFTKNSDGIYWNESQYRHGIRKQEKICGADYCRACNGLSLFIRVKIAQTTLHYCSIRALMMCWLLKMLPNWGWI